MTPAEKLRKIVRDAKDDELEQMEWCTREARESGQYAFDPGNPWEKRLKDCRQDRAEWQAASDLLDRLLQEYEYVDRK